MLGPAMRASMRAARPAASSLMRGPAQTQARRGMAHGPPPQTSQEYSGRFRGVVGQVQPKLWVCAKVSIPVRARPDEKSLPRPSSQDQTQT